VNWYNCSLNDAPAALAAATKANGGLAPLDVERFWADQEAAIADPFGSDIPQVPLGIKMSWECIPDELGIEEDPWHYLNDPEWALQLNKAYNDLAERIVGKRLLSERLPDPTRKYPPVKTLADIFEAKQIWVSGSWWLEQSAHNVDELKALLDRVDERDVRRFILPENWDEEKERLMALGVKPPRYRHQRGPVTFAMSVYGVENLIFLILDEPDLAARFRDTILRKMLEIARVLDEEAGYTPDDSPRGFGFSDDNCALLTPEMYRFFGYPILQGIFAQYSPEPQHRRYQHSDSAMGHLLPLLGELGLTVVNFGPTLTVSEIREHLPNAVIHGQLAPFTFSRNEEEKIVAEFIRDYKMAREKRGLVFATAGSINNGSRLTGMRLIMSAIQHFGRYD
jgi:uroporphyrinogen decarboxylase